MAQSAPFSVGLLLTLGLLLSAAGGGTAAAGGACLGCRRSMKESPQTCLTALDTSEWP